MKALHTRLERLEAQRVASRRPDITGFRVVIYDPNDPPDTPVFRLVSDDGPGLILLPDNGRGKAP